MQKYCDAGQQEGLGAPQQKGSDAGQLESTDAGQHEVSDAGQQEGNLRVWNRKAQMGVNLQASKTRLRVPAPCIPNTKEHF